MLFRSLLVACGEVKTGHETTIKAYDAYSSAIGSSSLEFPFEAGMSFNMGHFKQVEKEENLDASFGFRGNRC